MRQPGLVFFGSPPLAGELLRKLCAANFRFVAAVTQPDRPAGRAHGLEPPAVKTVAEDLGIKVFQPTNLADLAAALSPLTPAAGVLFAYGRILPSPLLESFPYGILNLHPSLLPRYRGPSPVPQAILDGANQTGVSIIRLDEQVDHGPIIDQQTCEITAQVTADELLAHLVRQGSDLLVKLLPQYLAGELRPRQQEEALATYTKPIGREDGRIDWSVTAADIFRKYRAYVPWPGVFTVWEKKRLKLLALRPVSGVPHLPAGTVAAMGGLLCIACGQGAVTIARLQLEGKGPADGKDFLRGHSSFAGSRLG